MVVDGGTYIDAEVQVEIDLLKEHHKNSPMRLLETEDQQKVLALLGAGLSNEEIGAAMGRKTRWVEEEVKQIYEILDLSRTGSGDSRRIRAATMFHEDRMIIWENTDTGVVLKAQDRHDQWRLLEHVKQEENEAISDAKVIDSNKRI